MHRSRVLAALTVLAISNTAFADHCASHAKKADIVDTAIAAGSFKTLATALTKADLVDVLKGDGPFTVFAPTDEAFAKIPKHTLNELLKPENKQALAAILTYHVVPGRVSAEQAMKLNNAKTVNGQQIDLVVSGAALQVDGARVTATDIECSNGVIHVIDSVIMPSEKDIVETAAQAGSFKTLLAAAEAAGLVSALQAEGPLTVFAPTDEAFAKLPEGTVDSLLKPENREQLAAILTYHVASGRAFAADALAAKTVNTLQGEKVRVQIKDGKPRANDATIIKTDIDASNGVIHVIDQVLMPSRNQMGANDARELIELAIRRGAPMFNHGDAAGCTAVYEVAANGLMNMSIGDAPREHIARALRDMRSTPEPREQAWILRRALDAVYSQM